ncbi:hypothetical protein F4604DRAFT_1937504 [Suillus subluteus]|nr:hypothetical protein F4604DRAFT_1937504 [Suillus subluteus]
MLALQGTSSEIKNVGAECVLGRFHKILKPFVGEHMAEFWFMIHTCSAVINGSCAMQMLRDDDDHPTNLNTIVPADCALLMAAFIIDTLHYHRIQDTQINYSDTKVLSSHSVSQCGPLSITVSEAVADGIFKVIATSHTTADMTLMTAGGLTVFYPLWTLKGIAITNHSVLRTAPGQNIGCIERPGWEVYTKTTFLKDPCGSICPTLWRNVADGGPRTLVIEWDHRFPMKGLLQCSNVMWRLSDQCGNISCQYNTVSNGHTCHLPPTPMPHNWVSIEREKQRIEEHIPSYKEKYLGVLYATAAATPKIVPILLRDGLSTLTHISHLQVQHWVNILGRQKHVMGMSRNRKTYNVVPDPASAPWMHSYTFFREDPMAYAPLNAIIRTITNITSNGADVMGNVLVVKHARGNKHNILCCTEQDIEAINTIMQRTIGQAEFWT